MPAQGEVKRLVESDAECLSEKRSNSPKLKASRVLGGVTISLGDLIENSPPTGYRPQMAAMLSAIVEAIVEVDRPPSVEKYIKIKRVSIDIPSLQKHTFQKR